MPKPSEQLPAIGTKIKFRIKGDKHLHEGEYKDNDCFQSCGGMVCYCVSSGFVDYWRPVEGK
jgi:hypothetical protein